MMNIFYPFIDDEKLTPEILKEFSDLEKSIQKLEKKQPEERLMLLKFELKNTEDSVKIKSNELEAAKAVAYEPLEFFYILCFFLKLHCS